MSKEHNEKTKDIRGDVESTTYSLEEPMTLLDCLSHELEFLQSKVNELNLTDDKDKQDQLKELIIDVLGYRLDTMTNLNNITMDLIDKTKAKLLDLSK